jgi:hypothetical protein
MSRRAIDRNPRGAFLHDPAASGQTRPPTIMMLERAVRSLAGVNFFFVTIAFSHPKTWNILCVFNRLSFYTVGGAGDLKCPRN